MSFGLLLSTATCVALLILVFLSTSCSLLPPGSSLSGASVQLADQLRTDVEHLAGAIGERNLYRPEKLEEAASWIEGQFHAMGYQTVRQPVFVRGKDYGLSKDVTAWNIEALLPGTTFANEHLVIGAHYDSRVAMPHWHDHGPPTPEAPGTPGANDNGSGVATVLALARTFARHPQARTIRFVAFVNEEPPFYQTEAMGSLVYARQLRATGIRKVRMITPETLGCYSVRSRSKRIGLASIFGLPDRPDYIAFAGNQGSRRWIGEMARQFAGHSTVPVRTVALPAVAKKVAWSDDWSFWQCGYPAFAVTDTAYFRSDHYHETTDTPDTLDYEPMAEVVSALGNAVREVANDSAPW